METKKVGWYILLFGVIIGIVDYLGLMGSLINTPTEPFGSWVLTPIAWSAAALIIVGAFMIKFGSRRPIMPVAYG